MLRNRVIPLLLLERNRLVKTKKFQSPVYVGDPINTVRIFNKKAVDEIIILDIGASRSHQPPNFNLVAKIADEAFMPVTYGGGISSVDHAKRIIDSGIEKVSLQTAMFRSPHLVSEIASLLGTQSVVGSIDIVRNFRGQHRALLASRKKRQRGAWQSIVKDWISMGVGEILLTCVEREGTFSGPDFSLIKEAASRISVPLIAAGGVASHGDIRSVFDSGASGAGVGAFFVFQRPHNAVLITYPAEKELDLLSKRDQPGKGGNFDD